MIKFQCPPDPLEVLQNIAEDRLPCSTCGKAHNVRELEPITRDALGRLTSGETWADPDDGHPYRKVNAMTYAKAVVALLEMEMGR